MCLSICCKDRSLRYVWYYFYVRKEEGGGGQTTVYRLCLQTTLTLTMHIFWTLQERYLKMGEWRVKIIKGSDLYSYLIFFKNFSLINNNRVLHQLIYCWRSKSDTGNHPGTRAPLYWPPPWWSTAWLSP